MRGKQAKKRTVQPDAIYNSEVVARFINRIMFSGKKSIATKLVYEAMEYVAKETKKDALESFLEAIETIKPKMEVRSRRVGGANYQVPVPVREERQEALAMRWIIASARKSRNNTNTAIQLGKELVACIKKESASYKKKEDGQKMAEANKAFAQFGW